MQDGARKLLSVNNYYYARGGAEVLFLEQNRILENAGWQVVPFTMRHSRNLATPWDKYFPDEIEFGGELRHRRETRARDARHLFDAGAGAVERASRRIQPPHRARPQHLPSPFAVDPVPAARPGHSGRHDGARPQARLPRLHDDARKPALRELPRAEGSQRPLEQMHQGVASRSAA